MWAPPTYASFLVRLWRKTEPERGTTAAGWQGELEHIQTNHRWIFSTWDELLGHLQQVAGEADALRKMASQ